jgi:hypothetical protein
VPEHGCVPEHKPKRTGGVMIKGQWRKADRRSRREKRRKDKGVAIAAMGKEVGT